MENFCLKKRKIRQHLQKQIEKDLGCDLGCDKLKPFLVLPCWFEVSWRESRQEERAATGRHRSEWRRRGNIPTSASLCRTAGNESEETERRLQVHGLLSSKREN